MRRFTFGILFNLGCTLLLMVGIAIAEAPGITAALDSWQGPKEAVLTENGDRAPQISKEMLHWLQLLLANGFAVRTDADAPTAFDGLILDVRTADEGSLAILRRGRDGAVLALEKSPGNLADGKTQAVLQTTPPLNRPTADAVQPTPPFLLETKAQSLVWLGSEGEGTRVALLGKNGVTVMTLSPDELKKGALVSSPGGGWRPLFLTGMQIDDGPERLLSAVWAEEIKSIYEGTDSRIWSQLLRWDGATLSPTGAPIAGYVRFWGETGATQQRGAFSQYAGPILPFLASGTTDTQRDSLPWGERGLFDFTPLDGVHGLAWSAPGNLVMVKRLDGEAKPGGGLLEDLGAYAGAEIVVRLEEPVYRSGFDKEGRVLDKVYSLPPRIVAADGSAVTIRRGRSDGMALLGRPQGEDTLVRIDYLSSGLQVKSSFASVSMFIVDFALIDKEGKTAALLLLNERADGRGKAYLQRLQEGN